LSLIIVLIIRNFPQLTLLDVDHIPALQEQKKKNEMLKQRADVEGKVTKHKWVALLAPVVQWLKEVQLRFRQYVGNIERKVVVGQLKKEKEAVESGSLDLDIQKRIQNARYLYDQGNFDDAEKQYLLAIRLDAKCVDAYRGLGDVYLAQENLEEAKETYQFVLHLSPNDDQTMVRLADIAEEEGKKEQAVEYYQQAILINDNFAQRFVRLAELLNDIGVYETALESIQQAVILEPQNPKYLDKLTELSIIVGDKNLAKQTFQHLRMVNPENQKLSVFQQRIAEME